MDNFWPVFAFAGSIISALSLILNQHAQLSGRLLVLLSRALLVLLCLPIVQSIAWPREPLFYGVMLVSSILVFYADRKLLDIIATYNSGTVSRLMPLTRLVTFVGWAILTPMTFVSYFDNPYIGIGIIASFLGSLYFGMRLKQCDVSKDIVRKFTPVIAAYGVVDILNKIAMSHSDYHQGVWYYIFIQSIMIVVMAVFFLPRWIKRKHITKADVLNQKTGIISIGIALTWLGTMVCRNYAITLASNPAFAVTIVMLAPVWIVVYNRLIRFKDESDILSGLGVVACSIIMAILTLL